MLTHALLALALLTPGDLLVEAVSTENVLGHLQALQAIADANDGNRAAGTSGYDASADYVAAKLRRAGYQVTMQPFEFPFFRELAPASLGTTLIYSGSGDVTSAPQRAGTGCTAGEFKGFAKGRIALVKRGECSFATKADAAVEAGAAAVVVVNKRGPFMGSLDGPVSIPVVGVDAKDGTRVAKLDQVRVFTKTISEMRTTHNVIADRPGKGKVVMVGAHLDSVQDGPGINDNGSGSAATLEIALQAARLHPSRPVRFAWWGAEEEGLLGSTHYVASLSEEERARIKLYLNLDMVASPNATFGIYDGDDSDKTGAGPGPKGSARIERAFEKYFTRQGLPYMGTDFTGRSDYGPFIEAGIPSGGLFTGAEEEKTHEEAKKFGGAAGNPQDGCYHQACDTIQNVDEEVLGVMTEATASALETFAWR
ncbi:M28 family metallopeptidase [Nonomuraea sp. NPDC050556]|uniref:M28 family metallopeptidase n=1 Tax=Nonomuraea sp. NPDC050556 TaxID=3364369 RepID=UPI00378D4D23